MYQGQGRASACSTRLQRFLDKYFDAWKSKDIAKSAGRFVLLSPRPFKAAEGSLEMCAHRKTAGD